MSASNVDVPNKLMAWLLGGVGTLLVYSAYKKQNPMNVLQGVIGEPIYQPATFTIGPPFAPVDPNSPGVPPGTSEAARLRLIASRLVPPTLVNIPGSGQLDMAPAASLSRINTRLGFTVMNVGAYRSYSQQAALYASDPQRFADPRKSLHVVGLALDVHSSQVHNPELVREFTAEGWHRARWGAGTRNDEPWHWSYGIKG